MKDGAQLIVDERERQKTLDHVTDDTKYKAGELLRAAVAYIRRPLLPKVVREGAIPWMWPWSAQFWKPTPDDRVRELVKAGALIAAEIDRIQTIENNVEDSLWNSLNK